MKDNENKKSVDGSGSSVCYVAGSRVLIPSGGIGFLSHRLDQDYWAVNICGELSPQAYHWEELKVV